MRPYEDMKEEKLSPKSDSETKETEKGPATNTDEEEDKSLLLSLLTDICLELAYSTSGDDKNVSEKEVFSAVVYSELRRGMQALDLDRINVADLKPESLAEHGGNILTPRVQEMVINLAKKLMDCKVTDVKKAVLSSPASEPTPEIRGKIQNKTIAEMENVFKEISTISEWNKDLDKRIRETIVESTRLYWHFLSVELKSLEILLELVEDLVLMADPSHIQVKTEFLLNKCEALFLKLKAFHYMVLRDTYPRKTNEALRTINSDLGDSIGRIKQELEVRRTALNQLQGVGAEFQVLVSEYKAIREEIVKAQWSLNKLEALKAQNTGT
ncbi:uncharacterized protein LOC136034420 isoform X2 [Artemia franciscana]|uniref:uncharacterized protein LOC136034420 isoform X2 n=1 Tax=Artemia franciscana TaxID=6661 RepID=UPI0032DA1811